MTGTNIEIYKYIRTILALCNTNKISCLSPLQFLHSFGHKMFVFIGIIAHVAL